MSNSPQHLEDAFALADRAVIADIETGGIRCRTPDAKSVYDVRPLLDPFEHCNEAIEWAEQALRYARLRGLVADHPNMPGHVRVLKTL